jgi:hypothetical protein
VWIAQKTCAPATLSRTPELRITYSSKAFQVQNLSGIRMSLATFGANFHDPLKVNGIFFKFRISLCEMVKCIICMAGEFKG